MQSYNTHMKQKIARSPPPPMSHLRDAPVTTPPPPLSFAEFGQINLKFKKMQSVPMVRGAKQGGGWGGLNPP